MSDFNRPAFFAAVRDSHLLGSTLSGTVVGGLDGILDAWAKYQPGADLRHVAYTMATAWHEARLNMAIREGGRGVGHEYGKPAGPYSLVYYGRGPSQLTWHDNYVKFGKLLGVDLERFPDTLAVYGAAFIFALPDILDAVGAVDITPLLPDWIPGAKFASALALARIVIGIYVRQLPRSVEKEAR